MLSTPQPEGQANPTESVAPVSVPIGAIEPNPYQPRTSWSDATLGELAESIRQKGLLQPLLVRRSGDSYQLIAGERRYRAAQLAGLTEVPVVIRAVDDGESLELALIENLQREDLNPLEEARAYQRLSDEFDLTQEEIARRIGKSRSAVANSVRLLDLPADVRDQIRSGAITAGHARSLLSLASSREQSDVAHLIVTRKLSVREAERLTNRRSANGDLDVKMAESALAQTLGTRVHIHGKKGGAGRIEIEYYSLAGLNGLIARMLGTEAGEKF